MKKWLIALLAAAGLASGVNAEGTGTKYDDGNYAVYKSTDAVLSTTGQTVVTGSVILHEVIVSSPSNNVDVSTNAVLQIYNGTTSAGALRAEVNLSTQSVSGVAKYTFDIAMSSGIWTDFSGSGTNGKVTMTYSQHRLASPDMYRVWSSTYMAADTGVHRLAAGPVLLHKIIVLTKGTGTSVLTVYDSYVSASPSASNRVAGIDLTDAAREYTFNVLCSSGITFQASGAGTVGPTFIVLYKRNPSQDYEVWRATFTTGAVGATAVYAGPAVFGGVVNGDSVAGSSVTVYNANGAESSPITTIFGTSSFDRRMYDVQTSSGITYSGGGNGLYSILWKKRAR